MKKKSVNELKQMLKPNELAILEVIEKAKVSDKVSIFYIADKLPIPLEDIADCVAYLITRRLVVFRDGGYDLAIY